MKYLFLLRGLPASGKDYFIDCNNLRPWTLSSDEYRMRCGSPIYNIDGVEQIDQTVSNMAWKKLRTDLENRMARGDMTIINATNISKKDVLAYRTLCKKYFYKLGVIDFTDVDVYDCKERNWNRPHVYRVPEKVIDSMAEKLKNEQLPNSIKIYDRNDFRHFIKSVYKPIGVGNKTIHVIGDIHGCYTALKDYMSANVNMDNDIVVFVGDYFDRGAEEVEVFNYLSTIMEKDNVYMLIGNHELHMFRYLRGEEANLHFDNVTLPKFKKAGISDKKMKRFCSNLIPTALLKTDYHTICISHAGIPNKIIDPLLSDTYFVKGVGKYDDIHKVVESFDNKTMNTDYIQVFGHRNPDNEGIKFSENSFNVCGFPELGRTLKAVIIKGDSVTPIEIDNTKVDEEVMLNALRKGNKIANAKLIDYITVMQNSKFVNENKFGNISSFNFTREAFYDDVWNGITTKARGLFYNMNNREIVARSYDKFFLLNQHSCSTIDNFEFPLKCYEKYDGFLGIIGYDRDKDDLIFCSKSMKAPEGEYAQWFKDMAMERIEDYESLKKYLRSNNISLVCEVIIPDKDPHIIKYNMATIVFLDAVKNIMEFAPLDCSKVYSDISEWFKIPRKMLVWNFGSKEEFDKNLVKLKSKKGIEGYVFLDVNNKMFKLKTYEYESKKLVSLLQDYGLPEEKPTREWLYNRYGKYYDKPALDLLEEELNKLY